MGRAATFGSWFQFYLCGIDVVAGNGKSTLLTKPLVSCRISTMSSTPARPPVAGVTINGPGVTKLTDQTTPAPAQPRRAGASRVKRTPVSIGGIGILVVLMVAVSAFFLNELPLVGAGARYSAEFTEAAGLKKGNEVRVAGIKVGEVDDVALDGERVKVTFRANNTWIGDRSEASIQIKTVLGQKYLAVTPLGDKLADPDTPIPLERTVSPLRRDRGVLGRIDTADRRPEHRRGRHRQRAAGPGLRRAG